jgi:O-antigen ligase
MNVIRLHDPRLLRPLHVVMIALLTAAVAGASLLLSAAESPAPVDGAIEWSEESPLRAVVQLLCLNYRFPTTYAGEVKNFILAVCAALAVIVLAAAVVFRGQADQDEVQAGSPGGASSGEGSIPLHRLHVAPLAAAQVLAGLYLAWSLVSSRWSPAPELSVGECLLLILFFFWSFGLAHGLSPRAAAMASRAVVAIGVVMALAALWYYYGRNPTLRAKFPVGNPTLLATCLIPPMVLAVAQGWCAAQHLAGGNVYRPALTAIALLGGLAVMAWALVLTGSRGPAVGLGVGFLALVFFEVRGKRKWIPVVVTVGLAVAAVLYFQAASRRPSLTGRSETIRFRHYSWSYAYELFLEKPFTGYGQGAFAMLGDARSARDVLHDPLVFGSRIAHAHNEWLQVLSELGATGLVLLGAVLVLTLLAAKHSLEVIRPASERWTLLGLSGSLVGLCAAEAFGVGLRTSAVPTYFFSVLGLTWAMSDPRGSTLVGTISRWRMGRIVAGASGGLIGLFGMLIAQQDFADARNGYRAEQLIEKGEYEEAIRLASGAVNRLNVQRALEGRFRLAEAHMRVARELQGRAADRERRAAESEVPEPALLNLARVDRELSDEHCRQGSAALTELLRRSPGYIRHGWVSYWLNVVQAGNAEARGDAVGKDRFLKAAGAALDRELLREPFDPEIAILYFGIQYGLRETSHLIDVLARPLRYHRISVRHIELFRHLEADTRFAEPFVAEARAAQRALQAAEWSPVPVRTREIEDAGSAHVPENPWAPEKLRLAAVFAFQRNDLATARAAVETAAEAYERFAVPPHFGAAACLAELADCRLLESPGEPAAALAAAEAAEAYAPESEAGRALKSAIRQRMVEYRLAAGQEEQALRILRETAPYRVADERVHRELALRYQQLLRSLLTQRDESGRLREGLLALRPRLVEWGKRAIELQPEDPAGLVLAAQVALESEQDSAFVEYVKAAVGKGLATEDARRMAAYARNLRPQSAEIQEFAWSLELEPESGSGSAKSEAVPPGADSTQRSDD